MVNDSYQNFYFSECMSFHRQPSDLQAAKDALASEMSFPGGGWHMQNIVVIKHCLEKFKQAEIREFVIEIVAQMRSPHSTSTMKFKLAQLLNLLKSFQIRGFEDILNEYRNQILHSYIYLGDKQLGDAAVKMINNLWNIPNISKPIPKPATRVSRVKINTPTAAVLRKITVHAMPILATGIHSASPPPLVE